MEKWANYYVSAVHFDSEYIRARKVRVHRVIEPYPSTPESISREDVIRLIEDGKTFVTISPDHHGRWQKQLEVRVAEIEGSKFLRVDDRNDPDDHFGNIMPF